MRSPVGWQQGGRGVGVRMGVRMGVRTGVGGRVGVDVGGCVGGLDWRERRRATSGSHCRLYALPCALHCYNPRMNTRWDARPLASATTADTWLVRNTGCE